MFLSFDANAVLGRLLQSSHHFDFGNGWHPVLRISLRHPEKALGTSIHVTEKRSRMLFRGSKEER
jgi:hypothetical protein